MENNPFLNRDLANIYDAPGDLAWQAIAFDRKVEAIREVRALYGYSLLDAKNLVEAWITKYPRQRTPECTPAPKTFTKTIRGNTYRITEKGDGSFVVTLEILAHSAEELTQIILDLADPDQ